MRKILRRACYRVFEIYDTSRPPRADRPRLLWKLATADSQRVAAVDGMY